MQSPLPLSVQCLSSYLASFSLVIHWVTMEQSLFAGVHHSFLSSIIHDFAEVGIFILVPALF